MSRVFLIWDVDRLSPAATIVDNEPSLSYFHKILTPEIIARLNSTSELTLFLPVDSAWDALHPIEKQYLESEFASDDLQRIFDMHAVVMDQVRYSDSLKPAVNRMSHNFAVIRDSPLIIYTSHHDRWPNPGGCR